MNNNLFWERVKTLLKDKHQTQQDLCNSTGIILGTLKGWITNERLPDAEYAVQIADALDTSVEYLVTGKETSDKKFDNLVQDIQQLLLSYSGK